MKLDNKGISIIETVICVAVIGVLSLFSYPSFMEMKTNLQHSNQVMEIVSDLQLAKISAIENNCRVVIELAENGYTIFADDGAGKGQRNDWVRHPDERIISQMTLARGFSLSHNFSKRPLHFSATWRVWPGTIKVQDHNENSISIIISRLGRIRTEKS